MGFALAKDGKTKRKGIRLVSVDAQVAARYKVSYTRPVSNEFWAIFNIKGYASKVESVKESFMRIAVGNDHAGLPIKAAVMDELRLLGHEVSDLGTNDPRSQDFPDFAGHVGRAIQDGKADRGVLICGSGIGVCIAANKMHGVRASIAHDTYSAHQGVEHDGMNVLCLGGRTIGDMLARELVRTFVNANFQHEERFIRRVNKINTMEATGTAIAE
jgi:ribose 5-phosphate isomerase B